jgi:hypothetical protein
MRPSRHLEWISHLGRITLEIEVVEGNVLHCSCTPQQASILHFFQDGQPSWTISDLAIHTEMSDSKVLACLQFWLSKGVLTKSTFASQQLYSINSVPTVKGSSSLSNPGGVTVGSTGTSPSNLGFIGSPASSPYISRPSAPQNHSNESSMHMPSDVHEKVYRNFINMFLMNQELGIDRLHERLNMAIIQNKPTLDHVRVVLGKMIAEGLVIESGDGKFKVKR